MFENLKTIINYIILNTHITLTDLECIFLMAFNYKYSEFKNWNKIVFLDNDSN